MPQRNMKHVCKPTLQLLLQQQQISCNLEKCCLSYTVCVLILICSPQPGNIFAHFSARCYYIYLHTHTRCYVDARRRRCVNDTAIYLRNITSPPRCSFEPHIHIYGNTHVPSWLRITNTHALQLDVHTHTYTKDCFVRLNNSKLLYKSRALIESLDYEVSIR